MKNLDRYTTTSLFLADFLSDPVRRIILAVSKCDHLLAADRLLDELCTAVEAETKRVLHTNPVAMKKVHEDARTFGFAESELSRRLKIKEHTNKIAVCTWEYSSMVSVMLRGIDAADIRLNPQLTGRVYDKARKAFRHMIIEKPTLFDKIKSDGRIEQIVPYQHVNQACFEPETTMQARGTYPLLNEDELPFT